jgi:hypothetical protein
MKGLYNTTKEELLAAIIPIETRSYKPVTHQELIDLTLESIESSGFTLDKENYSSSNNGDVATARYTIKNVADKEMQLQIAFQNSYNKKVSLKFGIGSEVKICSNGMITGDFGNFKRKHTGDVQVFTPKAITQYIKQSEQVFKRMQKQREAMKEIEISKKIRAEIIGKLICDAEIIESTQLNIIKSEYKNPTHDYKCKDSLYELYQFTTFSMKDIHPTLWMKNHIDVHSFFVNESGLILPEMKKLEPTICSQLELFIV